MPRKRYVVTGIVQGVGYRYFAQREAIRLGIRGFVRNLANGSVEVEASGEESRLDAFAGELARGPEGGSVKRISQSDMDEVDSDMLFVIRG